MEPRAPSEHATTPLNSLNSSPAASSTGQGTRPTPPAGPPPQRDKWHAKAPPSSLPPPSLAGLSPGAARQQDREASLQVATEQRSSLAAGAPSSHFRSLKTRPSRSRTGNPRRTGTPPYDCVPERHPRQQCPPSRKRKALPTRRRPAPQAFSAPLPIRRFPCFRQPRLRPGVWVPTGPLHLPPQQ